MIRIKQVQTEHDESHPIFGNMHVIDIACVDEDTGQRLTNEDIKAAFLSLNIVGVYVKLRGDKLFSQDIRVKQYPGLGVVTAIDDAYVWLGNFCLPKQEFLEWYELD